MDFNDRIEREPYYPPHIKFFHTIAQYYPPIDSVAGIIAFTSTIFIVFLTIRFLFIRFFGDPFEQPKERTIDKNSKLWKDLEERRKKKTEDAKKLLERITKG